MKALRCWLALLVAGALSVAGPALAAEPPRAADLHEEVHALAVTVKDGQGREQTVQIPVTSFRPDGPGPFPLAVVSHGRSPVASRGEPSRQRFEPLSRYLVAKGFAVFVPTRVGYGQTLGPFDPEASGSCSAPQLGALLAAGPEQVLATVAWAKTLTWVDASRWVALGQSVGGVVTAALAARQPPGLVAAISFSGGQGGNPSRRPGNPCSPQVLESVWRGAGPGALTPLWLYWANDLYWGPEVPQRWAAAWREGGRPLQFHLLPAKGRDGHRGLHIDMDTWAPLVEQHLARAGFTQPGLPVRPVATGFAELADAGKVPTSAAHQDSHYRRFLAASRPRAFAIGPRGAVGWASGDWAIGHALARCPARPGETCKLYAVDDDVVWAPEDQTTR